MGLGPKFSLIWMRGFAAAKTEDSNERRERTVEMPAKVDLNDSIAGIEAQKEKMKRNNKFWTGTILKYHGTMELPLLRLRNRNTDTSIQSGFAVTCSEEAKEI